MHLTGAATVKSLHHVPVVVTGDSAAWLKLRGFGRELRALARRGR